MKPGIAVLLVGAAIVGLLAAGPVAGAVGGIADVGEVADVDEPNSDADGEENETRPGERLGGVIGVQAAEIDGEVDSRAFERQVDPNRSDDDRGAAVADRVERAETRLTEIETRQAALREQRDDGEITHGEYRARTARLAAETASIERTMNRSAAIATDLPKEVREDRGIDDDRIRTLSERANELSGSEVAEIARGIAGPNVGDPVASGERPDHAGPPDANKTPEGPPGANETQLPNGTVTGPPESNETRGTPPDVDDIPSDSQANASSSNPGSDAAGSESESGPPDDAAGSESESGDDEHGSDGAGSDDSESDESSSDRGEDERGGNGGSDGDTGDRGGGGGPDRGGGQNA